MTKLALPHLDFTAEHLRAIAQLSGLKSLSLGDRACLAVAQTEGLTAVTCDAQWKTVGVAVRLIRGG